MENLKFQDWMHVCLKKGVRRVLVKLIVFFKDNQFFNDYISNYG